ncbi:zinc finger CCHC-type and RNA-binding motif-containing protein 1-like isoform X2 [Physella acuta]|uniref:zinc finger CCHC-type and RNA-binding motif-containing protein 1-like isoform X2 n=1 Tax=Physella acuta TaxID=109671 RepID=UPI0027DB82F9|nr:zinc finger CCHC-type and RNA-binding motif-containing protein 1-like isoform X2 [Physella acuta]
MQYNTSLSAANKLAPSKSTVYVSNLPFSLTNNDLHKIFEKYGKVVRVTVMRDKNTRKSKGVAFVLFLDRDGAYNAMFDRTISCSIAKDNGRAPEFIRRREYVDKSRCYECGEEGHLSYKCPKNLLGEREPPPKKKKKRKHDDEDCEEDHNSESDDNENSAAMEESLALAIKYQQAMMAQETTFDHSDNIESTTKRKRYKKDAYFSDEEELDD